MGIVHSRHLERSLPVSGLERGPACHPERSEGSGETAAQILRCAQDDMPSLQMGIVHSELQVMNRRRVVARNNEVRPETV